MKLEILRAAQKRIERGWNQGCFALKLDGSTAHPTDAEAVSWCALGAVYAEAFKDGRAEVYEVEAQRYEEAVGALASRLRNKHLAFGSCAEDDTLVIKFNDFGWTQRENVLSLFRETIENLGQATTEDQACTS